MNEIFKDVVKRFNNFVNSSQRTCLVINEWALHDIIDWNKDALKIFGRGYQISKNSERFLGRNGCGSDKIFSGSLRYRSSIALSCLEQVPTNTYIKNLEQRHGQTVHFHSFVQGVVAEEFDFGVALCDRVHGTFG